MKQARTNALSDEREPMLPDHFGLCVREQQTDRAIRRPFRVLRVGSPFPLFMEQKSAIDLSLLL